MTTSEHRTWLSSVAFLDVVNFSERSIQEQLDIKQHLDSVLRDQLHSVGSDDYMLLDRGDARNVSDILAAGSEAAVLARLQSFADAGVTDLSVRVLPIGEGRDELLASSQRIREFLSTITPEI